MTEKRNIFLIGPMGAGKSTVGRQLAQQLKIEFFDSDQEIEKCTGADISWIFDMEGEIGFRKREERIINEITQKQRIVLATGGGSIKSNATRKHLSSRGIVIYLKTTIEKQLIRTKKNKKRPLLQTKIPPNEVLELLSHEREPLYKEIANIIVCTDQQNAKIITEQIIHLLKNSN